MIRLKNVEFSYGKQPFISGLSCEMADGRITALLGPNGSGKSTTLRLCAGLLRPAGGTIDVGGRDLRSYPAREFARTRAFLPQSRPVPTLTVRTLVENGRYPYLGLTRRVSRADKEAVERALELTGLRGMAGRELHTLSGGERQKAYVAMLVAQGAQHLLLDEPTTYLDVGHQLELMEMLQRLRDDGKCIIMVLHDISLAIQFCDEALVMADGKLIHTGTAAQLAESGAIERAYGVRALKNTGIGFERI